MDGHNEFIAERMRVEAHMDQLSTMPADAQLALTERIKKDAEAKSAFKMSQLVRVCRSPGFSLETMTHLPHDHDDPSQHFDSRVMGWDSFGRIEIALTIHDNPHNSKWCWIDHMISLREAEDWAESSTFKADQEISFVWEHPKWPDRLNRLTLAVLRGPHIEPGDWLVLYEKPCGMWITRVLNERYMLPR